MSETVDKEESTTNVRLLKDLLPKIIDRVLGFSALLSYMSAFDIARARFSHEEGVYRLNYLGAPLSILLRGIQTGDPNVLSEIFGGGLYNLPNDFSARLTDHSSVTIVDAGANAGFASIKLIQQLLKCFGIAEEKITITAVEIDEDNSRVMEFNIKGNFPKVELICHQKALTGTSTDDKVVRRDRPGREGVGSLYYTDNDTTTNEGGILVDTITMPDILREVEDFSPNSFVILKMDIEGGEEDVFKETDWLKDVDLLYIESHEESWGVSFAQAEIELKKHGFELLWQVGEDRVYGKIQAFRRVLDI